MTNFFTTIDSDGVATIAWNQPGTSLNVLTLEALAELDHAFDAVLAEPAVKGVILTSAKKDFAGGMDLNVIAQMKADAGDNPALGLFNGTMAMHAVCSCSSIFHRKFQ